MADAAVRMSVSSLEVARKLSSNEGKVPMQCDQCSYQFEISKNSALNKLCPYCGSTWIKVRENEVEKIVGGII